MDPSARNLLSKEFANAHLRTPTSSKFSSPSQQSPPHSPAYTSPPHPAESPPSPSSTQSQSSAPAPPNPAPPHHPSTRRLPQVQSLRAFRFEQSPSPHHLPNPSPSPQSPTRATPPALPRAASNPSRSQKPPSS